MFFAVDALLLCQAENSDRLDKLAGLRFETICGGSGFLNQSGVLLRYLIHLGYSLIDLLDTVTLLGCRVSDFADQIGHPRYPTDNVLHRRARRLDKLATDFNALDRLAN
jgi:hypothetical protein